MKAVELAEKINSLNSDRHTIAVIYKTQMYHVENIRRQSGNLVLDITRTFFKELLSKDLSKEAANVDGDVLISSADGSINTTIEDLYKSDSAIELITAESL